MQDEIGGASLRNIKVEIVKVLNNNVILSRDISKNQEMILVGKGIGFGKKNHTTIQIPQEDIEKVFRNFDKKQKEDYVQLIDQLDSKVMGVSEEIIAAAEKQLGTLNSHIHIALTDHIGFALERLQMGMEINNPFLFEIKKLYPEEFKVANMAKVMIQKAIGIGISESEVGFIALHLHSARQNKHIKDTMKDTRLLKECIEIIEQEVHNKVDEDHLTYTRLITHLRIAINRVENNRYIENPLLHSIREKFQDSYRIAAQIGNHISKNKDVTISEDELGYMAIHIQRLKEVLNK